MLAHVRWLCKWTAIVTAACSCTFPAQPKLTASVDSNGVLLSWDTVGSTGFLTGVGRVRGRGSAPVKPKESRDYVLVISGDEELKAFSVHVTVGQRERDNPPVKPDPQRFHYEVTGRLRAVDGADFVEHLYTVLQDELMLTLFSPELTRDRRLIFITRPVTRNDLKLQEDRHIAGRQVAYLIEISLKPVAPGMMPFAVRSCIEYRRDRESVWRTEGTESGGPLYERVSRELKSKLEVAR